VPVYAAVRPILQSAPVQSLLERLANSSAFAATLNASGSGLLREKIYQAIVLYIVTIAIISIPAAILGVLLYRFLGQLGASRMWSALIVLVYGLGTSAFPYSNAFFSHQFVACLLFGAFYIGFQMRRGALSPRWAIVAGLLLSYAVISEYPSALIAAAIFVYIVLTIPQRRWLAGLVIAGLPPLAMLIAYDLAIFHTPLPVGYEYSALYTEQHSTGFLSLTLPRADALWGVTFGSFRGLFYVSPILLLAVAGLWAWWRSPRSAGDASRAHRAEWAVSVWATLSFFLFNGSSVMWQGGFSIGPRYLVPMLPFLALGLGAFAARWGGSIWARALTAITAAWSVAVIWAQTLGGQSFPDWTPDPLINYSLPHLAAGNIARNVGMVIDLSGWISLIPLAALVALGLILLKKTLSLQPAPSSRHREPPVGDAVSNAEMASSLRTSK
jgi:hypothetical protein